MGKNRGGSDKRHEDDEEADLLDLVAVSADVSSRPPVSARGAEGHTRRRKRGGGTENRDIDGEADLLDLEDVSTVASSLLPAREHQHQQHSPQQQTPRYHNRTEREGDLLDLEEDDGGMNETTGPAFVSNSRIPAREHTGEGDILDLDDESTVHENASTPQQAMSEIRSRKPMGDEAEGELLDLEDVTTITGGASSCEGDMHDLAIEQPQPRPMPEKEADLLDFDDISCSTSNPPLLTDPNPSSQTVDEKALERQRKLAYDASQQQTALAAENDRIASKMMAMNNTSSKSDETPEQKKLREYREAQRNDVALRQVALAEKNNDVASKMTALAAATDTVTNETQDQQESNNNSNSNSSAERQAALAAENQRIASKMTSMGALADSCFPTPLSHQQPQETNSPEDVADSQLEKERDLETGEDAERDMARAHEVNDVDTFMPIAVEYDTNSKPLLLRNRRFQLYSSLAVFCSLIVILATSIGLSGRKTFSAPEKDDCLDRSDGARVTHSFVFRGTIQ